jgi:hypothetical protein
MENSELEGDAFRSAWMQKRAAALSAAGFDPLWQ